MECSSQQPPCLSPASLDISRRSPLSVQRRRQKIFCHTCVCCVVLCVVLLCCVVLCCVVLCCVVLCVVLCVCVCVCVCTRPRSVWTHVAVVLPINGVLHVVQPSGFGLHVSTLLDRVRHRPVLPSIVHCQCCVAESRPSTMCPRHRHCTHPLHTSLSLPPSPQSLQIHTFLYVYVSIGQFACRCRS